MQCFYGGFCGLERSRVEISTVKIGWISSPELEGAQGLVGFPVQGLVGFPIQGLVAFLQTFSPKVSINWEGSC